MSSTRWSTQVTIGSGFALVLFSTLLLAVFAVSPTPPRYHVDGLFEGAGQSVSGPVPWGFRRGRRLIGLGFTVRADRRVANTPLFVGGGLGYRFLIAERPSLERFDEDTPVVDLSTQDLTGSLRLALCFVEGLDLYSELGGGPSFVDVVSHEAIDERRETLVHVTGLGGLTLSVPRAWFPSRHLSTGVDVGLGYEERSRLKIRRPPSDTVVEGVSYGGLRLRGFLWRAAFVVRFL